jgi:hypothetical protein
MNWDLTSYFPVFDGPDMRAFRDQLRTDIDNLGTRASGLTILGQAAAGADAGNESLSEWEVVRGGLSPAVAPGFLLVMPDRS